MRVLNATDFGNTIRTARKKAKLTQSQVAASSGVGERFVRELEKGKVSCQLDKALWIAQILGIKIEMQLPIINEESQ